MKNDFKKFVNEGIDRVKSPTPKWFKWLRWGAYVFAGASGGIVVVVSQPWSTIIAILGAFAMGVAGTTYLPIDNANTKKNN